MSQNSYKPKELLTALIEVDKILKSTINKNCPENKLLFTDDLDKSLEEFLQKKHTKEDDIGYLSSQMALFHLQRELENTIAVVIDSNNLRAFHDFKAYKEDNHLKSSAKEKRWNAREAIIGLLVGSALASLLFYCKR